jgi:tetratricopeptide (TPR) repeat protein
LRGDLTGAWNNYEKAVASLEQLLTVRPDQTDYLTQLVEAYRRAGDLQGNPAFFHFDNQERARAFHEKGLKIAEQLAARDPQDAQAQGELSLALRRIGLVMRSSDPEKSAAALRRALDIVNTLLASAPGDLNHQRNVANTRLALSTTLRVQGKLAAALEQLNAALEGQRAILKRNPGGLLVREDMFDSLAALGDVRLAMGQADAALEQYNAALDMAHYLVERAPDNLYSERCLALASRHIAEYHAFLARQGAAAERSRHAAEAAAWYDKAIAIWSRWRSNNLALPYSARQETDVARARLALGQPAQ